jgi:transcriptional regulator with XRE-family HTH domain
MTNEELVSLTRVRRLASTGEAQALRLGAGLSLREVAAAVGISHSNLWRWEAGQRTPRGRAALAWAVLLAELANLEGGSA